MLISRRLASNVVLQRIAVREWNRHGRISCRQMSSSKSGSRRALLVLGGVAGVTAVLGGGVAAASYDPDLRDRLETLVPGASSLLSAIIGDGSVKSRPVSLPVDSPTLMPIRPPSTSSRKKSSVEVEKNVDSDVVKSGSSDINEMTSLREATPPPFSVSRPISDELAASRDNSANSSSPSGRPDGVSAPPVVSIVDQLPVMCDEVMRRVDIAIVAQQKATEAVNDHAQLVLRNMDDQSSTSWSSVSDSAVVKRQLCESADQLANSARQSLDNLRHAVNTVNTADDQIVADLVERARSTLSQAHYLLRLAHLKHKSSEADSPHHQTSPLSAAHDRTTQLETEYRHQFDQYQRDMESQLTQHLSRQAAAHTQHLQDELRNQERTLRRRYQAEHEDQLRQERLQVQSQNVAMMSQLHGIQHALKERAHVDKESLRCQRLFTACQMLYDSVVLSSRHQQHQHNDLDRHLAVIKQEAGDDRLVNAVVASASDSALSPLSGAVSTQWQLQQRYSRVERSCRQLALIDERGGSLFKYAISYLHSLLVVDAYDPLKCDLYNDPVTSDTDTMSLLARARHAMDVGDLSLAVRYLGQLRGESALAASSWLNDSRQLLELQQAAVTLMTHVSAASVAATQ